jgi:hypothetical protein
VFRALLAVVGGLALLAVATHMMVAWALFFFSALALAAFCGLWAWTRSVQMDRAMKVRTLHQRAPELALRRAASS